MSLDILNKKANTNNFIEIAGSFYRNNDSDLIKELNQKGDKVYFGIQNEKGIYTAIGEDYLFFSTKSGIQKKMSNIEFLEEVKKISLSKVQQNEFITIGENYIIWIYNIQMLSIILSLVLFLTRIDGYGLKSPDGASEIS